MRAESIHDVNQLSGWPKNTQHLVLFRDPEEWLNAIYRWGLDNGWFCSEDEFLTSGKHRMYLSEWHNFYMQWQLFSKMTPELVLILRFSDLRVSPHEVFNRIDAFAGVSRSDPIVFPDSVSRVRHSKPMSVKRKVLSSAEIKLIVEEEVGFDWKRYLPQKVPS